jgi:hypothetical protein
MKVAALIALVVLALVGVLALGFIGIAHFENPSSQFGTYDELRASGLIERGWVPDYLPRSATEIEESHDIDTNRGWASFKYKIGDTAAADQGCRLLHQTKEGRKYLCPPFEKQTAILVLRADGGGYLTMHADEI